MSSFTFGCSYGPNGMQCSGNKFTLIKLNNLTERDWTGLYRYGSGARSFLYGCKRNYYWISYIYRFETRIIINVFLFFFLYLLYKINALSIVVCVLTVKLYSTYACICRKSISYDASDIFKNVIILIIVLYSRRWPSKKTKKKKK